MPKTTWTKIEEIMHQCKEALQLAYSIELLARKLKNTKNADRIKEYSIKLRKKIGEELEKLNDIVLEQINGENNET